MLRIEGPAVAAGEESEYNSVPVAGRELKRRRRGKGNAGPLSRASHLTRLQTLCANENLPRSAPAGDTGSLKVREKTALGARSAPRPGTGVDVTDILAELRPFAADGALSHSNRLQ